MEKIIQSESVFNDESPFHTYDVEKYVQSPNELSALKNINESIQLLSWQFRYPHLLSCLLPVLFCILYFLIRVTG